MIPDTAYIYSKGKYPLNKKICGLYPLERLINVLAKGGVNKIHLDLSEEELSFYRARIKKYIGKIKDLVIIFDKEKDIEVNYIRVPSNLFMQSHYLDTFKNYFKKKKKSYEPQINSYQFLIMAPEDINTAAGMVKQRLLDTTEGYISKNINKKISVPISEFVAGTRVHPNTLTLLNFVVGMLAGYMVFQNRYWSIALGGALFQLASIFDGVDGEVAKFTFRSSKLGGWLDTICDHVALFYLIIAIYYVNYLDFGMIYTLSMIIFTVLGLIMMVLVDLSYLREFSSSQSLKAYDVEFISKLPPEDFKVKLIQKTKYLVKKEAYSLIFFFVGLTGKIHYTIPLLTATTFFGSLVLLKINSRYFPLLREGKALKS
jgi:phosphatidylglycerophosphate synthase